ncbi:trypsin-like peptidase domain-containing protein [Streptomyces sp. NPDC102467]|uniref:trypsin-like peptidase domain-containing protein n=1 Tax=Streptomyces sp. NPDC102467 TaxID=3366179 RepID=UPI003825FF77
MAFLLGPNGEHLGMGIPISKRRVLTCAHVLAERPGPEPPRERYRVQIAREGESGTVETAATAVSEAWLPDDDVAVVELDDEPLPSFRPVRFRSDTAAAMFPAAQGARVGGEPDDRVRVYGPVDGGAVHMWVRLRPGGREVSRQGWLQLDAADAVGAGQVGVQPGFSGGGVFDASGNVVGMLVERLAGANGEVPLVWALPVGLLARLLPGIVVDGPTGEDRFARLADGLAGTRSEQDVAILRRHARGTIDVYEVSGTHGSRGAHSGLERDMRDAATEPGALRAYVHQWCVASGEANPVDAAEALLDEFPPDVLPFLLWRRIRKELARCVAEDVPVEGIAQGLLAKWGHSRCEWLEGGGDYAERVADWAVRAVEQILVDPREDAPHPVIDLLLAVGAACPTRELRDRFAELRQGVARELGVRAHPRGRTVAEDWRSVGYQLCFVIHRAGPVEQYHLRVLWGLRLRDAPSEILLEGDYPSLDAVRSAAMACYRDRVDAGREHDEVRILVEFRLPRRHRFEPVDRWTWMSPSGVEAGPIGAEHELIVRDLEQVASRHGRLALRERRRAHFARPDREFRPPAALIDRDGSLTAARARDAARDPDVLGGVLMRPSPHWGDVLGDVSGTLLDGGLFAVVVVREPAAAGQVEELLRSLSVPFDQLLLKIRQLRAGGGPSAVDLRECLTVLWNSDDEPGGVA